MTLLIYGEDFVNYKEELVLLQMFKALAINRKQDEITAQIDTLTNII